MKVFFIILSLGIWLSPSFAKIPLYIGGLFPMTSLHKDGWTGGTGILPAAEIAIAHVNNAGILPDYELMMLWNDTGGFPGLAEHLLFEFLYSPPRKVMILGAGYSSCSTVVASLAGLDPWSFPQISYSSTSPELSNKAFYPNFYRTIPADTSFNAPRIALLKTFNWSSVGILYQEEDIHRAAVEHLQLELHKHSIRKITSEGFRDSAVTQMATLKKRDARIIIGNFFGRGARKAFCEAYKLNMYGARYQWIILGYIERDWWLVRDPSVDCTAEEMLKAANYHIMTDYLWHASYKVQMVSGKTVGEYFVEYNSKVPVGLRDEHGSYAHDAIWAMAIALNGTASRLPGQRLDLLPYGHNHSIQIMRDELRRMNFTGATGPVAFTDTGDRLGDTMIMQFIDGVKTPVAWYRSHLGLINWTGYQPIIWQGGSPPSDSIKRVYRLSSISTVLYLFMGILSICCIVASFFFLWFNTRYRGIRYIKMSSPNLNNVIILGCVLNYTSVLLFGLDGGLVGHGYDIVCASRTWALSLGFSLAYGAMFSKTWRVHSIFTNRKFKRKIVKDRHLFVVVLMLVAVDVVYLTIWQVLDPLRSVVTDSKSEALASSLDVEIVMQLRHCESAATYRWLGILCGYKGLLLLFGAFLAWETRRVTIAALNDSKYIGMSVYNVFILCVIGAPMSLVMREQPNASFSIVSISIVFCTSITLCLVFIPKVMELRRFMSVGGQPENVYTSNTLGRVNLHNETTLDGDKDRQLNECRNRLAKSETEVQSLRRRLQQYEEVEKTNISESAPTDYINTIASEGETFMAQGTVRNVRGSKELAAR